MLTSWFNLFGWPSSIQSDGGPQFRGEFSRFCESHSMSHEMSAPYNPKSNGLAKAGVKSVKNILRKSMSSGTDADADFMLYEWRNVPRSDGYSPTQLMFGRAQRTSLPTLPSQNIPVNFNSAASSKDAAHARAKFDHDKSKLSLASFSPGQAVYLQDSKSSAWDKHGIIVSVRPDRLSYVINVDNRFFTRPRRLLWPVASATPFPVALSTPPSSPPEPRRSLCLQSRANSVVLKTTSTTSNQTWLPSSSVTVRNSLTRSVDNSSLKNTLPNKGAPLLPLPPSTCKIMLTSLSKTVSEMSPATSRWISRATASHLSTYTGPASVPASPQSSPLSWLGFSLPAAATSAAVGSASLTPATPSSSMPCPHLRTRHISLKSARFD